MRRKPTVLVIDTDEAYCLAVRAIVEPYGADVLIAHGVDAADTLLEVLRPDVLIVDMILGGLDGLGFIRGIRSLAQWKTLPVIVAGATTLKENGAAIDAGATECISKPFSAKELRDTLRRFLPLPLTAVLRGI
jgi:two-component system KDP operon response regulator KdpE